MLTFVKFVGNHMPSAPVNQTIARQWQILNALPSRAGAITAHEVSQLLAQERFSVSGRTIERDLNALKDNFQIDHTDERPRRWFWIGERAFKTLSVSLNDALTLQLLERYLTRLLPRATTDALIPTFELARRKLKTQADGNELARYAALVAVEPAGMPVIAPAISPSVLAIVQECLLKNEMVDIWYLASGKSTDRQHRLYPLGLLQSGEKTYLLAAKADRAEPVQYAIHRITKAVRTYCDAPPRPFSMRRFVEEGGTQPFFKGYIRLDAWVSTMLGSQLIETKLSEHQQLVEVTGGYRLSVQLPDSLRLQNWILSWSDEIEVIAPADLRERILKRLSNAIDRYKHGGIAEAVSV